MTDTFNTTPYIAMHASVIRGARTICYVKAAGAAIRRAGLLFFFLLAISPICELFGLMSVQHIAANASHTKGVGEFFGFFSNAFLNTEIQVQTIAGLAVLMFLIISGAFLKEIFRSRFVRSMRLE
jgi:hypothetical protein